MATPCDCLGALVALLSEPLCRALTTELLAKRVLRGGRIAAIRVPTLQLAPPDAAGNLVLELRLELELDGVLVGPGVALHKSVRIDATETVLRGTACDAEYALKVTHRVRGCR